MAMYKVRFVVYKKPTGKTMFLPTFARAVGSICLAVAVFLLAGLAVAVIQNKGQLHMGVIAVFLIFSILGIVLGIFLRERAEHKAQTIYQKTLAEMEEDDPKQKPN